MLSYKPMIKQMAQFKFSESESTITRHIEKDLYGRGCIDTGSRETEEGGLLKSKFN